VYDEEFVGGVDQLPKVGLQEVTQGSVAHDTDAVRVEYGSDKEFENMAKQLKLMADLRVSGY
jgi:hypothetical protein